MRCGPGYDLIELWEPLYLAQRAQKPPSKVVFGVKCPYFHPELPIFPPSKDAELHLSYSYQVSAKSIHFCQSYGQKRVLGDFLDAFLTPEWVKSATIRCYFKLSKHRKILDIKPLWWYWLLSLLHSLLTPKLEELDTDAVSQGTSFKTAVVPFRSLPCETNGERTFFITLHFVEDEGEGLLKTCWSTRGVITAYVFICLLVCQHVNGF